MRKIFLSLLLLACSQVLLAQKGDAYRIPHKGERTLPADLKDETILFLKFDSVKLPNPRPKGYTKAEYLKWEYHNKMVPQMNKELRESAAKYPFKYKIISMNDPNFKSHGAKYLFWMNTFDTFTEGVIHDEASFKGVGASRRYESESIDTILGVVNLRTLKKYIVSSNLGASRTIMYEKTIAMLIDKIEKQFK